MCQNEIPPFFIRYLLFVVDALIYFLFQTPKVPKTPENPRPEVRGERWSTTGKGGEDGKTHDEERVFFIFSRSQKILFCARGWGVWLGHFAIKKIVHLFLFFCETKKRSKF